ncbi:MAG: hypothetical protein LBU21_09190, partial [Treponema sp.]|nr:hypothetical protein [Treponema sp.]
MCRKTVRTVVLTLLFSLVVSLGTFGGGRSQRSSSDLVTLTALHMSTLPAGIQEGYYWTEILKEDLGIALDFVPSTPENIQTYLASGDIPDISVFNNVDHLETAIRAGLVVNYDDYRDKLPNVFANFGTMLQYVRDNLSAGTGGLYSLRHSVSNQPSRVGTNNLGPYLRWDYYKELGYPEIANWEDYLPVLKAMVDRHPLTESGQKVYGISLWSNWDVNYMSVGTLPMHMMGQYSPGGFLEVDMTTHASRSFLDDTSYYKRALKFYYSANQMGILDPDSITQAWDTFLEKGTAGRSLFSLPTYGFGNFNTTAKAAQGIGSRLVPFTNEKIYNWGAPTYIGARGGLAVSKKTTNLEKSLAFVDYYSSYDGVWQLVNGRKGVKWDLDEQGQPYLTELGWRIQNDGVEFPNGGKNNEGTFLTTQEPLMNGRAIHPVYKRRIDGADWIKKSFAPPDTALVVDWKRVMNAEDDMDYFIKHNMLVDPPLAGMPVAPDDIQLLVQRIGQVVQPTSWKMVYAKDEAEFNALWADMVSQAKGIGIDRVNQWYLDAYNAA